MKWEQKRVWIRTVYISCVSFIWQHKRFLKMDCWKLDEINRKVDRRKRERANNAIKDRRHRLAFWVLGE